MKKCSIAGLLLSLALLGACRAQPSKTTPASNSKKTSQTVESSSSESNKGQKAIVKGNDEIGYLTFSFDVIRFVDANHDETIANTRQWTDPETMAIATLVSYPKADYTQSLQEYGPEAAGMSELDLATAIYLDHFNSQEDTSVALEQDFYNDLFYESNLGLVTFSNGAALAVVSFQPSKDSDTIYLLSTEGSDKKITLSWLGELIQTWSATKPAGATHTED